MIYILGIFMLWAGYYGLSYSVSLWKEDNNKLGSIGTAVISIVGSLVPLVVVFLKR